MKYFKRGSILLLLMICIFSGVNNAQDKSDTNNELTNVSNDPVITEEFRGDDLKVVLDYLVQEAKINIKYDDSIEAVITCKLDKVPLNKALEIILSATPYTFKKVDGDYFVYNPKDEALVSKSFTKEAYSANGPTVTNIFIGDDLLAVLDIISSDTGINIMYANNVQGVVTCKLENVPVGMALEIILAATPYTTKKRGDYYVVTETVPGKEYQISGNIGIAQVKMEGLPGEVYTDANGYYSANVEAGFSGRVQPVKEGYKLIPSFVIYNNIDSDRKKQDYKASKLSSNQPVENELNEPVVTNEFMSDDLPAVLDVLAKDTKVNIMYDNAVDGFVTCKLNKMFLSKALEIIFSPTEYIVKKMDDYFLVTSPELDDIKNRVAPKKNVILGSIKVPLESIVELPCEIISERDGTYSISIPSGFKGKILIENEDDDLAVSRDSYSAESSDFTNINGSEKNQEVYDLVVTNEFVNEDLHFALNVLAMETGINIMYPDTLDGLITCKLDNTPLSEALEIMLAATPYKAKKIDGYYLIYSPDYPVGKAQLNEDNQDTTEPKVTDIFSNDDLQKVLNIISSNTGINIMFDFNVQGTVNCNLKNVPLGKSLEMILAATPFVANKRDGYYVVTEYLPSYERYQLSGNVGIPNVKMAGLPGEVYTDSNGYYSVSVNAGFSGKVQPIKDGYNFNPSYIIYNNLKAKRINQDYQAAKVSLIQSARKELGDPLITENLVDEDLWSVLNNLAEETGINIMFDSSIEGVISCKLNEVPLSKALEIIFSTSTNIIKKMDSFYLVLSPEMDDIKNRVTSTKIRNSMNSMPLKEGILSGPSANQDFEARQDVIEQNNEAENTMLNISDTIEFGKNKPMSGVEITAEPGGIKAVTDSKGQFSIQVPYGWTGKITLSKPGIKFSPDSVSFKNVTTDIINNVPVPSKN